VLSLNGEVSLQSFFHLTECRLLRIAAYSAATKKLKSSLPASAAGKMVSGHVLAGYLNLSRSLLGLLDFQRYPSLLHVSFCLSLLSFFLAASFFFSTL